MESPIWINPVGALRRFEFLFICFWMSFATTGRLPGLPMPTEAQQQKIQTVAGTIAGMIRDSRCSDMEAKAVLSNLILEFGTLEQYSQDQQEAFKTNYKQKRYRKANNWRVR